MVVTHQSVLFAILLFLVSQQTIYGLQCYECSNCMTPKNLVTVKGCDSGCSCTKITSVTNGKVIHIGRGYTQSCTEYNLVLFSSGYFQNCCTGDGFGWTFTH
ncbi:unnamed protein product [Adineta ricciae]|uniref:Uncharacterized protein n=1 Tax=Adineta ricciae TaxID=249248 RepID=A0A815E1B3_ADIRI|nr:unnamed protein product [Adineta ricciae]